jgi:hypothetical protein
MSKIMAVCEVQGGNQLQRELAHQVVQHCVNKLIPSLRRLDITVKIQTLKPLYATHGKDLYATCEEMDHREYVITIDRYLKPNTFVRYLCHEMVHVMQYAKELLRDCHDPKREGVVMWKGRECLEKNYSYSEQPWERQAFSMQDTLANSFFYKLGVSDNRLRAISYQQLVENFLVAGG